MLRLCKHFVSFTEKSDRYTVHLYTKATLPNAIYEVMSRNRGNRFSPNFAKMCLTDKGTVAQGQVLLKRSYRKTN